jgi:hypothetical protein
MSDQYRSFATNTTKSIFHFGASSSFYHHTTSAGRKSNEKEEDFVPLVIVPALIIIGICCTMLCLLKKYKICKRGRIAHADVSEQQTEITNDHGSITNK